MGKEAPVSLLGILGALAIVLILNFGDQPEKDQQNTYNDPEYKLAYLGLINAPKGSLVFRELGDVDYVSGEYSDFTGRMEIKNIFDAHPEDNEYTENKIFGWTGFYVYWVDEIIQPTDSLYSEMLEEVLLKSKFNSVKDVSTVSIYLE